MEQLELRINATKRLVLTPHPGSVVLEVHHATNWRDGHGWGVSEQVLLDLDHLAAMRSYLDLLTGPLADASTRANSQEKRGLSRPVTKSGEVPEIVHHD